MSLSKQDLKLLRMHIAGCDADEDSKGIEYRLTQEIGDQEEYYDPEPQLLKLIPKLEEEDLWRLVRLADSILRGEDGEEPEQYPKYEITQYGENNELRMVVRKSKGVEYHSYNHEAVLDQLIAYGFVKVK